LAKGGAKIAIHNEAKDEQMVRAQVVTGGRKGLTGRGQVDRRDAPGRAYLVDEKGRCARKVLFE